MNSSVGTTLCCFAVIVLIVVVFVTVFVIRRSREQDDRAKALRAAEAKSAVVPSARFTVVHQPEEMRGLVLTKLGLPDFRDGAPLLETVYVRAVTRESVIITAGNRTVTHWNLTIKVAPNPVTGGTVGTATLDRSRGDIKKWWGNIMEVFASLEETVRASDANGTFTGETRPL